MLIEVWRKYNCFFSWKVLVVIKMVATILNLWWWLGIKLAKILKQHGVKENGQNTTMYSIIPSTRGLART